MKIYTKTGDQGKTRLVGGSIASKSSPRIEAYGTVDELNSILGLISTECEFDEILERVRRVQNELFNLGSLLACEKEEMMEKLPRLDQEHISALEIEIDTMEKQLPPLKNFILPGGSRLSALFHMARTVCRRAERHAVNLNELEESLSHGRAIMYLNRLSDYLFVTARYCNHLLQIKDVEWKK